MAEFDSGLWFINAILATHLMQFRSVWQNGSRGCGKMVISNMIESQVSLREEARAEWERRTRWPERDDRNAKAQFIAGYVVAAQSRDRRIAAIELELAIRLSSRGML